MLPDKLQHQQLVKIGIEQRPGNWVQFPVVVVRPLSEVDDHRAVVSLESAAGFVNRIRRVPLQPRQLLKRNLQELSRMATRSSGLFPVDNPGIGNLDCNLLLSGS
jgi:hypothetical protein